MSQVHPTTGETAEEVKERLDNALDEHLEEEHSQVNESVKALVAESFEKTSETVELTSGREVTVKTSLPKRLEERAGEIDDAETVEESLDITSEIMAHLVVDDDLNSPKDWMNFHELAGSQLYWENLNRITEPYFEASLDKREETKRRQEAVDGFRSK